MRSISVYCIFDECSEIVITPLVANNDKVARKSFKAWLAKNAIDQEGFTLLKLGSAKCPDTALDVTQLIADKEVEPVCLGEIE